MNIIEFYKSLLESVNITVVDDQLFTGSGDDITPLTVYNKDKEVDMSVYLPTEFKLKNANWLSAIAFHPATECTLGGESVILQLLTSMIENKLHEVTQHVVLSCVHLIADQKAFGQTSLKCQEFLTGLTTDSTTIDYVTKIITKSIDTPRLLKIKLDRGGTIDSISYDRIAKLLSPMLDAKDPLYDIKASKATQSMVRSLYSTIIPISAYGSNSKTAPYLTALLTLYYHTATKLNAVISLLGKKCTCKKINTLWHSEIQNLPTLVKEIPQQLTGNSGLEQKKNTATEHSTVVTPGIHASFGGQPPLQTPSSQLTQVTQFPQQQPAQMSVTEALIATSQSRMGMSPSIFNQGMAPMQQSSFGGNMMGGNMFGGGMVMQPNTNTSMMGMMNSNMGMGNLNPNNIIYPQMGGIPPNNISPMKLG